VKQLRPRYGRLARSPLGVRGRWISCSSTPTGTLYCFTSTDDAKGNHCVMKAGRFQEHRFMSKLVRSMGDHFKHLPIGSVSEHLLEPTFHLLHSLVRHKCWPSDNILLGLGSYICLNHAFREKKENKQEPRISPRK